MPLWLIVKYLEIMSKKIYIYPQTEVVSLETGSTILDSSMTFLPPQVGAPRKAVF